MKSDFIGDFLETLFQGTVDIFRRESLQRKMMRLGGWKPEKFKQGWNNLYYRDLIEVGDNATWQLSAKGRTWARKAHLNYFKGKTHKWDGKWRVIIFDIPKQLHNKRDYFQKRLKGFDFYPLQKSVYVFPYPCAEELAIIGEQYKVGEYIDILIADSIGSKESQIRNHYGL